MALSSPNRSQATASTSEIKIPAKCRLLSASSSFMNTPSSASSASVLSFAVAVEHFANKVTSRSRMANDVCGFYAKSSSAFVIVSVILYLN